MERAAYWLVLAMIKTLQALPLPWVARVGRAAGALAYHLDRRHRRVAETNMAAALDPQLSRTQIRALAREHFRRLGENYCAAVKTASMSPQELESCLEIVGTEIVKKQLPPLTSCVVAIGHFGNFELYARISDAFPHMTSASTYRALKQPLLNRLLLHLRSKSGVQMFERRGDLSALQQTMATKPTIIGLLCDQHAGRSGTSVPFFGRSCSTSTAPAVFALRYRVPLFTAVCYRTRLAHWRIEFGEEIPTTQSGNRRPVEDIMREVNLKLESAVLKDPPNWFWVHDRWKLDKDRLCRRKKS